MFFSNKEITAIYLGRRATNAVYKGVHVIWQAVRSCFGSGRWIGNKPWIGKEKWKGTYK